MIGQARARAETYAALAAAFGPPQPEPPGARLEEALAQAQRELGIAWPQEELVELREAMAGLDEEGRARLSLEHTRLFEGPGPPAVYPYESFHRGQEVTWGEVADEVRRRYAAAGLRLSSSFRDLPDHVVAELELMAYLWGRQAQAYEELRWEAAVGLLAQSRSFLQDHLARWFPTFCQRVLTAAREPFHLAVASLARRFLLAEVAQWEDGPVPTGPWELRLAGEGCTLCQACALGCPSGALRLEREEAAEGLVFRPDLCDGCRRCLERCPPGLLELVSAGAEPSSKGPDPEFGEEERWLVRSPLMRCSRCGGVLGAEATWSWVRQRLAGSPWAETVSLCFQCRSDNLVRSSFR